MGAPIPPQQRIPSQHDRIHHKNSNNYHNQNSEFLFTEILGFGCISCRENLIRSGCVSRGRERRIGSFRCRHKNHWKNRTNWLKFCNNMVL